MSSTYTFIEIRMPCFRDVMVMVFASRYDLKGVEVSWIAPTRRGGKPADRANFVTLVAVRTTAEIPI